jgi:L-rhamnonate dehydratase
MMHPSAMEIVPMFHPQLIGEPVPVNGRIRVSALDRPGFGVELNRTIALSRPYTH